jgi:hypothetical protein
MYEDLIKALRCCAEPERCSFDGCPKLTADTYAGDCSLSVNNEAADAIEALSAELDRLKEANRWIPVTEKLPDEQQDVLIWFDRCGGDKDIGWYSTKRKAWFVRSWLLNYNVTHWMPLPEPPKETVNG